MGWFETFGIKFKIKGFMEIEKIWIEKYKEVPEEFLNSFKEYPKPILEILWSRNLKEKEEIEKFLNPCWEKIYDPFLMKGLDEAAKKIVEAIKKNKKICIFSDYDTDGCCCAALFKEFFERIDFKNYLIYIPSRKEGYGLSEEALKNLKKEEIDLIVTCDCGISDVYETEFAKKLGMEVIISDHHLPQDSLPNTLIVNPHLKGNSYPFKELSGTGVGFKLIQGILKILDYPYRESLEKWNADLLSISCVADFMPLLDENRIFTKFGLITLEKTRKIGLKELKKVCLLPEKVSAQDIAYYLAPRLNVSSKIDHQNEAYHLLTTDSEEEAKFLAKRLDEKVKERQRQTEIIEREIESKIKEPLPKILCFGSPKWPLGIISSLASKLREKYFRPVFLWREERFQIKGSARSIEEFNLVEVLSQIKKLHPEIFISFGGHKKAAGFTILPQYKDLFLETLTSIANSQILDEYLIPKIEIDAKILPEDLNEKFFEYYDKLEPFGMGNPMPVFLMPKVKVKGVSSVGENGDHLRLKIEASGFTFDAIGFRKGLDAFKIPPDSYINLVVTLKKNFWQGREKLDLEIIDWRR